MVLLWQYGAELNFETTNFFNWQTDTDEIGNSLQEIQSKDNIPTPTHLLKYVFRRAIFGAGMGRDGLHCYVLSIVDIKGNIIVVLTFIFGHIAQPNLSAEVRSHMLED